MRISDWSSDLCSSDLFAGAAPGRRLSPLRPCIGRSSLQHHPSAGARLRRTAIAAALALGFGAGLVEPVEARAADRKSVVEGKGVSVSVDIGGRRLLQKKHITI